MTDQELAGLTELLKDAASCARLSQWEEEFLDDFRHRVLIYGERINVSDSQWRVIRSIEEKVYA